MLDLYHKTLQLVKSFKVFLLQIPKDYFVVKLIIQYFFYWK